MDRIKALGSYVFDLQKSLSWRRMFAFLVGTGLLVWDAKIDQWVWFGLAIAFIGSEAALKIWGGRSGKPDAAIAS